jgi:hypothetical protein
MVRKGELSCSSGLWKGRKALTIENGQVRLVSLVGGGHIAEFRFLEGSDKPPVNPLWEPPWKSIEPYLYKAKVHGTQYGPGEGKLLSGIAGHNICLDYFGAPSEEEAAQGLSIHGEAPSARWEELERRVGSREASVTLGVRLPVAGLRFVRKVKLRRGESIARFQETVINERPADHFFHWVQHVTLGPPFLNYKESRISISAVKGRTWPHGYQGRELLRSSRDFRWPQAPGLSGEKIDLTRVFLRRGRGFIVTVLLDPRREMEFIAAVNHRHKVLIAYVFKRSDFPWVAIWEENRARTGPPWKSRSQARGLEFGSTPFPVGRREAFANGPLFATPAFTTVPARGRKTVRYAALLAEIPENFGVVSDIRLAGKEARIFGSEGRAPLLIPGGAMD